MSGHMWKQEKEKFKECVSTMMLRITKREREKDTFSCLEDSLGEQLI